MKESGVSLLGVLLILLVLSFLILGFKSTLSQQILLSSYRETISYQYEEEKNKLFTELKILNFSGNSNSAAAFQNDDAWSLPYSSASHVLLHKGINVESDLFEMQLLGFTFKEKDQAVEDVTLKYRLLEEELIIRIVDGQEEFTFNILCEGDCTNHRAPILIGKIADIGFLVIVGEFFWILPPFNPAYKVGSVPFFEEFIASNLNDFHLAIFSEQGRSIQLDRYKIKIDSRVMVVRESRQSIVNQGVERYELLSKDINGVSMIVNKESAEKEVLVATAWDGLPVWGSKNIWTKQDLIESCGDGEKIFEPYLGWKIGCEAAIKVWVLSQDV